MGALFTAWFAVNLGSGWRGGRGRRGAFGAGCVRGQAGAVVVAHRAETGAAAGGEYVGPPGGGGDADEEEQRKPERNPEARGCAVWAGLCAALESPAERV